MKYLSLFSFIFLVGFFNAQSKRPSIKFEADQRMVKVGETVNLKVIKIGDVEGIKWKIGGEEGKDWKFAYKDRENSLMGDELAIIFKKIGPTNVSVSAKADIHDSIPKGKKEAVKITVSLKYDRKGYLLVTEEGEYSELNQLFAEGTTESYIKLVKKASKLTENEKYSKDPFVYIWLARGLSAINDLNLDYTQGKYEPYKSAFNDAVSALSKALKYDNNGFLETSKFADFINEFQYKYFDEIVSGSLSENTEIDPKTKKVKVSKDFGKINSSLSKYIKITKNPLCIKHLQVACMYNLKDANAKTVLKEAEALLIKYTASKDSITFSPTDQLFFAVGVTELMKYYTSKEKGPEACDLQKRAIAALPELIMAANREKFEEFLNVRETECDK